MRGPWTIVLLVLSIGVTVALAAISIATRATRDAGVAAASAILSGFLLVNFWTLVVELDGERLELRFGLFARRIPRAEIRGAHPAEQSTRRYVGWGIRRMPDKTSAWLIPGAPSKISVDLRDGSTVIVSVRDVRAFLDALQPAG